MTGIYSGTLGWVMFYLNYYELSECNSPMKIVSWLLMLKSACFCFIAICISHAIFYSHYQFVLILISDVSFHLVYAVIHQRTLNNADDTV